MDNDKKKRPLEKSDVERLQAKASALSTMVESYRVMQSYSNISNASNELRTAIMAVLADINLDLTATANSEKRVIAAY